MRHKASFLFKILTFLMTTILLTMSAYAQSYLMFRTEQKQVLEHAKWRIGPFRISPSIQFRNVGYDNNIYYLGEDDDPISDYTATISTGISVHLLHRNWLILSISDHPEYIYYADEINLRAFNNNFSPQLRLLIFNRFVLSMNYSKARVKRRHSSEFEIPVTQRSEGRNLSIYYETARKTSFGFSWSFGKTRYDEVVLPGWEIELSRALNRTTKSSHFEFYYEIFGDSLYFLSLGYYVFEFEASESQWRNSASYEVLSGIQFPLLGKATGTLSLGYRTLLPREEGMESFTGFIGDTSLEMRTGRFNFRITYIRDFQFSFARTSGYFVDNRVGLGISCYLNRSVKLDYNLFYGLNNYPGVFEIQEPDGRIIEVKRRDKLKIHDAGIFFRIFQNVGFGLKANFWKRYSNFRRDERKRWFLGAEITFNF